ncbi:hypothetical protein [Sporosarcina sp. Marseille-Q4943]|uniref:hypothetical protein n=1 Tax=Sporosarcina sp. Marseille-Q4943 TaxID=2942204 RepID=UPI00208DBB32|nr:hypothetical protein [Sporosarcina sp. Marseille-Q4943]
MRERYFWAVLGLIVISWIANSLYAYSKQLKEPVFLVHYIEAVMGHQSNVTFYYLANKNDQSYINYIVLGDVEGLPQHEFIYPEASPQAVDTSKHQELRSITVELRQLNESDNDRSFNEMQVFYSDGKASTVSIGEVIIHPAGYFTSDDPIPLKLTSGGGSDDGRSSHSFLATEPLSIQKISTPFSSAFEDQLTVSITGNPNQKDKALDGIELPIHLSEGEHITVAMQLNHTAASIPSSFRINLSGTTAAGTPFTSNGGYNWQHPYLKQADVNRIIREKTGRDSYE